MRVRLAEVAVPNDAADGGRRLNELFANDPQLHEGCNRCCISEATWEDEALCECLEDGRSTLNERREGDMSEQERERVLKEGEDPDVEAHKAIEESDDSDATSEAERVLKEGDEPDVEAHNIRKP